LAIVRTGLKTKDQNDPTERERKLITPDVIIHNNGSLEQLAICAEKVVNDLHAGNLASKYSASSK
jgi:dephospho-CoA kinase